MSELDNFVSAVKEKRNDSVNAVLTAMVELGKDNEDLKAPLAALADVAYDAIDKAVGGTLDVVEERYADLVTGTATDAEGEEVSVELSIVSELSTLYFEEVAS